MRTTHRVSLLFALSAVVSAGSFTAPAVGSQLLSCPYTSYAQRVGPELHLVDLDSDGATEIVYTDLTGVRVMHSHHSQVMTTDAAIPAGNSLRSVAIADFNHDGRPDFVVTNPSDTTVSVVLSTGSTGYATPVGYKTALQPWGVAVGDLDGDGNPDVAVACRIGWAISVFFGDASGNLTDRHTLSASQYPVVITVSDVNADGRPDIVFTEEGNLTLDVITNLGGRTFSGRVDYATANVPEGFVLADVTGDGIPDAIVACQQAHVVSVLPGTGAGFATRTDYPAGHSPQSVAVADLNGDGRPDIVTANVGNPITSAAGEDGSILYAQSGGGFAAPSYIHASSQPVAVAAGHIDGDKTNDIALGGPNGLAIAFGRGDGVFGDLGTMPITGTDGITPLATGDFDGDGHPDLAANDKVGLRVYFGDGHGAFPASVTVTTDSPKPAVIRAGDVNADSRSDLVVINNPANDVQVFHGQSGRTFDAGWRSAAFAGDTVLTDVVITNFDHSAGPDLLLSWLTSNDNTSSIVPLPGLADLSGFSAPVIAALSPAGTDVVALRSVNLDGDTWDDWLALSQADNTLRVWLRNSTTTPSPTSYAVLTFPQAMDILDVDGDSHADVAVMGGGFPDSIAVFTNNGSGGLVTPSLLATPAGQFVDMALRDLNADGHPDILLSGILENSVDVMFGVGDGTFAPERGYGTGAGPTRLVTGDFHGTGRPDVAVSCGRDSVISLLANTGHILAVPDQASRSGTTLAMRVWPVPSLGTAPQISCYLPRAETITVRAVDVAGRQIGTLRRKIDRAGWLTIRGEELVGTQARAGMYFCQVEANGSSGSSRFLIVW